MGWLKQVLGRAFGAAPIALTFAPSIPCKVQISGVGEKIEPDECYLELYLESLRLERARKFATRFNGVVYSFVGLSREADSKAQFAAVSKPVQLAKLDENSLSKVITISKQMMGPTAWRGGTFSLELGLFSVRGENLLSSTLDYVTRVSEVAGISYVGAIKPFLPLITEGMELLTGQTDDTELEVGLDTDFTPLHGSVSAIIAKPRGEIDPTKLLLAQDNTLLYEGKPLDAGYAVFSLRRQTQKADFGEIPELKERFAAIQVAIRENNRQKALDALVAFRLTAIASPDLIPADYRKLIEKAESKVAEAFPGGGTSRKAAFTIQTLSDLNLYE